MPRDEYYWAAKMFICRAMGEHIITDPEAIEDAIQKLAAMARRYAKLVRREETPSEVSPERVPSDVSCDDG